MLEDGNAQPREHHGSNALSLENHVGSGRQLPPVPEDGMLINLEHESKLHAWLRSLCQGGHHQVRPVHQNQSYWDCPRYARAPVGCNPSGTFEQSLLRVMKGLSRACEFYAKLLLHGVYEFLERLRTLLTATKQATQTFAEKQAEEEFHPRLEAHLVTWITAKLPDPVKTRAYNRRSQPSVRIFLLNFISRYSHNLANRQGIWETWLRIQHRRVLIQ